MLKLERIVSINGEPRYYISCDEKIESGEKIHSKLVERGTEELFCENTNIPGIYSFGAKQLTDGIYHGAGYVWSSRAGCINGEFSMQLYNDCVVNGAGYWYVDINILKPLVEEFTGTKYLIEKYYPFYDKGHEEPNYRLVLEEVLENE